MAWAIVPLYYSEPNGRAGLFKSPGAILRVTHVLWRGQLAGDTKARPSPSVLLTGCLRAFTKALFVYGCTYISVCVSGCVCVFVCVCICICLYVYILTTDRQRERKKVGR